VNCVLNDIVTVTLCNLGLGSFKVTENGAVRQTMYDFLINTCIDGWIVISCTVSQINRLQLYRLVVGAVV